MRGDRSVVLAWSYRERRERERRGSVKEWGWTSALDPLD